MNKNAAGGGGHEPLRKYPGLLYAAHKTIGSLFNSKFVEKEADNLGRQTRSMSRSRENSRRSRSMSRSRGNSRRRSRSRSRGIDDDDDDDGGSERPSLREPTIEEYVSDFVEKIRSGGGSYSYPGAGCEEPGYSDIVIDNSESILQHAFAENFDNYKSGGGGGGMASLGGGSMASLGGGGMVSLGGVIDDLSTEECEELGVKTCSTKPTEYPQTELGVALGFFLILKNPDKRPFFNAIDIDQLFFEMTTLNESKTIFECAKSATISSDVRFYNYKENFKGTININIASKAVELIRYINVFIGDFKLKHPNIKITKVFLKGKGANSNDTADVLAEGIYNNKRITISIDVKKTAGARKSNLSAKKILDTGSENYWTTVVQPLHNRALKGIPRIVKKMPDNEKAYIRQQCTMAFSDKNSPFWTAILYGMRMNANVVANAIINYLCPEPKYDLLYNFSGYELIRSKTSGDVVSFSVSRCPGLELKKSGDPRQDLKMHFLCIIEFNDGTKRCFDLQLMWKGYHHSPPFYILFEIDCAECQKFTRTPIINTNASAGGGSAGGGGSALFGRRGGSRKHKHKSLRRRKTRRSKKN